MFNSHLTKIRHWIRSWVNFIHLTRYETYGFFIGYSPYLSFSYIQAISNCFSSCTNKQEWGYLINTYVQQFLFVVGLVTFKILSCLLTREGHHHSIRPTCTVSLLRISLINSSASCMINPSIPALPNPKFRKWRKAKRRISNQYGPSVNIMPKQKWRTKIINVTSISSVMCWWKNWFGLNWLSLWSTKSETEKEKGAGSERHYI